MKPATMAPIYASLYPRLTEVARENGYALAIHGTLGRDCDLLACPWTDAAIDAAALVEALALACDGWVPEIAQASHEPEPVEMPRQKPHGRLGWLIYMKRAEGYLDVSVMPRTVSRTDSPQPARTTPNATEAVRSEARSETNPNTETTR